jgi:hypothetical protein
MAAASSICQGPPSSMMNARQSQWQRPLRPSRNTVTAFKCNGECATVKTTYRLMTGRQQRDRDILDLQQLRFVGLCLRPFCDRSLHTLQLCRWWIKQWPCTQHKQAHLQHSVAAPPHLATAAPVIHRGVCIVNSEAENAVDAAAVRRLGYKLRMSPSCLPSLLITGKGGTFAFVLLDETRDDKTWERCDVCSSSAQLHATCGRHALFAGGHASMHTAHLHWCTAAC